MTATEIIALVAVVVAIPGTLIAIAGAVASRREVDDLKKRMEKLETFRDDVNKDLRASAVDVARAVAEIHRSRNPSP